MRTQIGMLLSMSLALVACGGGGGGNESVDNNGYCTSKFVSDYNDIVYSKFDANSMKSACDAFLSKHSGRSCKASVGGQEKTIYASDVSSVCKANEQSLARRNQPAPPPAPAPSFGNQCTSIFISEYNDVL